MELSSSLRLKLLSGLGLMMDHVYKVMKFTPKVIKELEESTEHGQVSDCRK